MTEQRPVTGYRFGVFEVDATAGELRRQGIRIKLHMQPFQLLLLFLRRAGEVLTREEIVRELWPEDTFVDYEHGVNSAINRLREALGDQASNPRFVETLARRGYRFVAPVEPIVSEPEAVMASQESALLAAPAAAMEEQRAVRFDGMLATPEDLPQSSHRVVQTLFVLLQVMYLGFYVGALANLPEINELFSPLPYASQLFVLMIVTAALLIPVRIFLLCAALFHAPGVQQKFLRLWWFLLALDVLWSLSPFLLLHHISYGLALACMTPLVYSPFAQRALILMGAGQPRAYANAL